MLGILELSNLRSKPDAMVMYERTLDPIFGQAISDLAQGHARSVGIVHEGVCAAVLISAERFTELVACGGLNE